MANPADISKDHDTPPARGEAAILQQLNNVVATLRLLTAKLDADTGVTDTNYAATLTNSGVATAPAKIV